MALAVGFQKTALEVLGEALALAFRRHGIEFIGTPVRTHTSKHPCIGLPAMGTPPAMHLGDCQNYGPFLGPLN